MWRLDYLVVEIDLFSCGSAAANDEPLYRVIAATADPVDCAHLRTESDKHHDNAGAALGTFTILEILYHHSSGYIGLALLECNPYATQTCRSAGAKFLIRCGFKSDFSLGQPAAQHIYRPRGQFLRQELTNLFAAFLILAFTAAGLEIAGCRTNPGRFNDFPGFHSRLTHRRTIG
jgi:hypothetical protein